MHEIALNALKALEGGAALTDPITKPGSYDAPSAPYHEYDSPLQEKEAGIDLLDNFATRCLNYLKNNGASVLKFVKYVVGEGIEKKEDNFAAEVAAAAFGK